MGDRLVDELVDTGTSHSWDEWTRFEDDYFSTLGFEENLFGMYTIRLHPSITGPIPEPNWLHFLPSDTVDRLSSTTDLDTALPAIIDETYDRVTSELDLDLDSLSETLAATPRIDAPSDTAAQLKGVLCDRLIRHLRGSVNRDTIRGDVQFPEEARMAPTEDGIDVLVTCHSDRNLQRIEVYSVENRSRFFETAFGDDTYMFEKLRQSDLRPEFTAENVAFDVEGHSWYRSEPPQDSIVYTSTDQKGRVDFYEVKNPSTVFSDSWGDVDAMRESLSETDREHVGYSSGDWYMLSGTCS